MSTRDNSRREDNLPRTDQIIWSEAESRGVAGLRFSPKEVSIKFTNSKCSIYVRGEKINPEESILLVRSTKNVKEHAYSIAQVFKSLGGSVSDSVESLVYPSGKLLPYINRFEKIKVIPTCFFDSFTVKVEQVMESLSYPIILKPQNGFRGQNVSLINNEEEFVSYVSGLEVENLMAQTYLGDIVAEFRAVIVGGKCLGVIQKHRTHSEENQFATELDVDTNVVDEEVAAFAEKAASVDGLDICGTDVARVKNGDLYLIENNRCPDMATFTALTKIDAGGKIVDFLLEKYS